MKFKLILAALLVSTGAFAAEAPASAPAASENAPAASPAPQTYRLEVTGADISVISAGLMEMPKRLADPLIEKLNRQLQEQAPKPQEPKK